MKDIKVEDMKVFLKKKKKKKRQHVCEKNKNFSQYEKQKLVENRKKCYKM